jgi:L-ascorbate metabolism protein UlaG (beta-lactamase superfamily)
VSRGVALLAVVALALGCGPTPVARRSAYHGSDADLAVTRIVHGSVILELGGTRLLVDPWFHSGICTRQVEPLGLTPDGLPSFSAVLITHAHPDHLDERALRNLSATIPEAIARPELHERLAGLGFHRVTDLGWWDRTSVGPVAVVAVPARHRVPENGYVLETRAASVYVAGDTRPFPELVDIATRFPHLDAALLPVGGERLLGFRQEMTPEEAAEAAATLGARRFIPIGYGKRGGFPLRWYARHPARRFLAACVQHGIDAARVVVLDPGESWHYYSSARAS